jgi:DUF1365 family protein
VTGWASAIYGGSVMHRRFRPKPHHLRYSLLTMLFDLDELEPMQRRLRLLSYNRRNLFALWDQDHGDGSATPLRQQTEAQLLKAGIVPDGGRIRLLCVPRILGYVFNPISLYFCERRDGRLSAILYEVHNTFGERHTYLIPVTEGAGSGTIRQSTAKRFYVSPFMDMGMAYDFRVKPPGETVSVVIHGGDADGPIIAASLIGRRIALSDRALLRSCVEYPLVTFKIILAIHWEALLLWLEGNKLRAHVPALPPSTTIAVPDRP